jgi:integrase
VADATAEWLRYVEHDRQVKPKTLKEYRYTCRKIDRDLGGERLEDVTPEMIEYWKTTLHVANRTVAKNLTILHGVFKRAMRVWRLPMNPVAIVERPRSAPRREIDAYTPEEVHALVRAASSETDAAIFLAAAFTGLRMGELIAPEWRDVDFAAQAIRVRRSYNPHGGPSTPKSGRARSVPMVPDVARVLAGIGDRPMFTADADLVFGNPLGYYRESSSLRGRYKRALRRADLRPLRFHDLRHTFGTLAVRKAEIPAVQAWMGHADVQTTMRYIHYRDRGREADLLAEAFASNAEPNLSA